MGIYDPFKTELVLHCIVLEKDTTFTFINCWMIFVNYLSIEVG